MLLTLVSCMKGEGKGNDTFLDNLHNRHMSHPTRRSALQYT